MWQLQPIGACGREHDVRRLIKLLTVKPEMVSLMTEVAIQVDQQRRGTSDDVDLESQKQEAIALCRRRIDAAMHLYKDDDMDREEYVRVWHQNVQEIAHWEARTTETEKLALELSMCVEAVGKLDRLWDISDDEDRQGLLRSLFEYLVCELDRQQIVDFRLKAWADRFIMLRAALDGKDGNNGSGSGEGGDIVLLGNDVANKPLRDTAQGFLTLTGILGSSKSSLARRELGHRINSS